MKSYLDLTIWQRASELFVALHKLLEHPSLFRDRYLREQLLRASLSVALNISEGNGRGSRKEFAHFLRIARGSLDEVGAALHIARKIYPALEIPERHFADIEQLKRSINALIRKLTEGNQGPIASRIAPWAPGLSEELTS
jgi:four helix bundle protein